MEKKMDKRNNDGGKCSQKNKYNVYNNGTVNEESSIQGASPKLINLEIDSIGMAKLFTIFVQIFNNVIYSSSLL